MPSDEHVARAGGISAVGGVVLLFVATFLHPMNAPPGDAPAAFAEYALDRFWVASHLGQLLGVVMIATGLVALSWKLRAGRSGPYALLAALALVASVSVAAALQAVDGVALKMAVDRWAESTGEAKALAFEAAYAVRQVEVGLASIGEIVFGTTVLLYGIALMSSAAGRSWLGIFGLVAGSGTVMAGLVTAHTGFSDLAMSISMPASAAVLVWVVGVGVALLRSVRTAGPELGSR